jgi:hypothetical protein
MAYDVRVGTALEEIESALSRYFQRKERELFAPCYGKENYCMDCRFSTFRLPRSEYQGEASCRKNPPVIVVYDERFSSEWPTVHADNFCGEFKPREEK